MSELWDVVVIGAGAAGLLAASRAASRGRRVLLLEKNRKAGVKILMSGGTRCNLTHAADPQGIRDAFGRQGRFLHSALAAFGPAQLVDLVESLGVQTKVEPTGKIFPASDKAADVLLALLNLARTSAVTLALAEPVVELGRHGDGFRVQTSTREIQTNKLIVATGGQSYPGCGTTGDGYAWAAQCGHAIVAPRPALTPITTRADWAKSLRGVTAPDVGLKLSSLSGGDAPRLERTCHHRGPLLFAHFGLSGPAVLNISREVSRHPHPRSLGLACDFLPDVSAEQLERQIRQCAGEGGRRMVSQLARALPRRLAETLMDQAGVPVERRVAELTRAERASLVQAVKKTVVPVTGVLGFEKAEVTAGGVALDEVDSRSMESKLAPNLYLAGELLDLDGPIGGYNFQAAFSTGWLAGENV